MMILVPPIIFEWSISVSNIFSSILGMDLPNAFLGAQDTVIGIENTVVNVDEIFGESPYV